MILYLAGLWDAALAASYALDGVKDQRFGSRGRRGAARIQLAALPPLRLNLLLCGG